MPRGSLKIQFDVKQSPQEVFDAVTNVAAWWGKGIIGSSDKLGSTFTYRHKDIHLTTQVVTELVPAKRLGWKIADCVLAFVEDKSEWNGTEVVFAISRKDGKTRLTFTHKGLTPKLECYDACSGGWGYYVGGSLKSLITKGKGTPDPVSFARPKAKRSSGRT